jgi:hypothetical protein
VDIAYNFPIHAGFVESFSRIGKAGFADRFKAHEELLAAALLRQPKEFIIEACGSADLAAPPFPVRCNGLEQRFCKIGICRKVVVPENDDPALKRSELSYNLVDGALSEHTAVHARKRAELASVWATSGGEHDAAGVVAPMKKRFAREWQGA